MNKKRLCCGFLALAMTISTLSLYFPSKVSAVESSDQAYDSASTVKSRMDAAREKYLNKLEEAKKISADDYSADSYAVYQYELESFDREELISIDPENYVEADYEQLCNGIDYIKTFLNKDKTYTCYDDLKSLIDKGNSINKDEYTEASYNKFVKKFNSLTTSGDYTLEKAQEVENEGKGLDVYKSYIVGKYRPCFNLLVKKDETDEIIKENSETGIKLHTTDENVEESDYLSVKTYDKSNWDWTYTGDQTASICDNYVRYNISLLKEDGILRNITSSYRVVIPIPDNFDVDSLEVELYKNNSEKGSIGRVSINKEDRTVTIKYITYFDWDNGSSVVLKTPIDSVNPATLNDGIYDVTANLTQSVDATTTSMADSCLDHSAYLVKNGDDVYIYLNFVPMTVFGTEAYCGGLWSEKGKPSDNDYYEDSETVLSYYTNDDGTIMDNSIYNGVTQIPCTKTIKLKLESSCYNDSINGYTLTVMSPTMAALNKWTYEQILEQWDTLTVNLMISKVDFLGAMEIASSYLPKYDITALQREYQYAKTLKAEDYTSETWAAVESLLSSETTDADGKCVTGYSEGDDLTNRIESYKTAVNNLVKASSGTTTTSAVTTSTTEEATTTSAATTSTTEEVTTTSAATTSTTEEVTTTSAATTSTTEGTTTKLSDGSYELQAEMVQIDRTRKSMSNNAINHTVKLDVVDGKYYITVQFQPLTIGTNKGYLSKLSYYDAGYTYNENGKPQGTVLAADVLSTYDVIDDYNDKDNPYPKDIKFPLVDNSNTEYVPLQVFVPIMEAISKGSGTQDVLMKLDWSTLKEATSVTTTTSTEGTTTTTTTTAVTTTTTTTTTNDHIASDNELRNWAINDYKKKNNDVTPSDAKIFKNSDGTYKITLTDNEGKTLDTYTVDPKTGEGTAENSSVDGDKTVSLPQTGNNSVTNLALALGALAMTGMGICAVAGSGMLKKKKKDN